MDLIKVGKFIAECRRKKSLTQEQLASKLYITDRAVSKWERGLSLPDADKMLELCSILDINVNELLMGEKIYMKEYNKKTDELLVEMSKQEEKKNKRLLTDMYVVTLSALVFYVGIIILAANTLEEGFILGAVIFTSTALLVALCFYGLKLEVEAGYYECNKCHHRFIIKYLHALIAPHVGTTRLLKCPKCHHITWSKKVMTKE